MKHLTYKNTYLPLARTILQRGQKMRDLYVKKELKCQIRFQYTTMCCLKMNDWTYQQLEVACAKKVLQAAKTVPYANKVLLRLTSAQ